MKISEELKRELVNKVLGFSDIVKVYVFEDKKLINFYAIRNQSSTYKDLIKFVSETTDMEMEHEELPLYFLPFAAKQESSVLKDLKDLGVYYEVYE